MRAARNSGPKAGDLAIGAFLLVVFAGAYLAAGGWPYRARLFPELVAAAGFVLTMILVVLPLRAVVRGGKRTGAEHVPAEDTRGEGKTEATDQSVEYVLAHTDRRTWAAVLSWAAAFFVALGVLGLYVTAPLFSLVYLRLAGRVSWLVAGTYAVVVWLVLVLAFGRLLQVPVPAGIFG